MHASALFSLLVVGVSAVWVQMLLIRELTASFYGNELFVGWLLFCWLFWAGISSFVFGRWIPPTAQARRVSGLAHSLLTVLIPLLIAAARCGRAWIGLPIAWPNLPRSMLFALGLLAPPTACLNAIFLAVAKHPQRNAPTSAPNYSLAFAYMWETLGFVAGGMTFGYALVTVATFRVAALTQWLNVIGAALWYAPRDTRSWINKVVLSIAAATATFTTAAAPHLERRTLQCMFPDQTVLAHELTIYGSLTVTKLGEQHNYYHGGALIGSDEDAGWNEQVVHLALLSHPAPKRILLIGGGLTGALGEILKHDPEHVDYVELDPALVRTARIYLPAHIDAAFNDPRVHLIMEDGRGFLNRAAVAEEHPRYDVVLVNTADPTSLFLNRYYTVECWRQVRSLLATGGIVFAHISFSPDSPSPRQARIASAVYAGLRSEFSSVLVLAEYNVFYIASADSVLRYDPRPLMERMISRRIDAGFVNPAFLEYRMTTDRNQQALDQIRRASEKPNHDTKPLAMFFAVIQWLHVLHPRAAAAMERLESFGQRPVWIALGVLGLAAVWRARRGPHGGCMISMATASFSLMACETSLLLLFQIVYGHLYYRIALIVAAVMLGLAAGSWTGLHMRARRRGVMIAVHTAFVGLALMLALLVSWQTVWAWRTAALYQLGLFLLACLLGMLGGVAFATANALLFAEHRDHRRAGWIYGADLLGSCAGAVLSPLWLIPLLGVTHGLYFIALANIFVAGALTLAAVPAMHKKA